MKPTIRQRKCTGLRKKTWKNTHKHKPKPKPTDLSLPPTTAHVCIF